MLNFFHKKSSSPEKNAKSPHLQSKKNSAENSAPFKFLDYHFDEKTFTATFRYQGIAGLIFTETVNFAKPTTEIKYDKNLLDRALFLSFILAGTSYYKANPTKTISLDTPLDDFQAKFFTTVYTDGLSQFIFENNLHPKDLVEFKPTNTSASTDTMPVANQTSTSTTLTTDQPSTTNFTPENRTKIEQKPNIKPLENSALQPPKILALQSGGKDSLLTATLLHEKNLPFSAWYLSYSNTHPAVLDKLPTENVYIADRHIDRNNLAKATELGAKNGHVPITCILQSFAVIQAILLGKNTILTSVGQEGEEPHAEVDGLKINHQWSKTWQAEQLFAKYVKNYISPEIHIGSPLRGFTELKIAKLFAEKCWKKYGHDFSSCNNANYRQNTDNSELKWCGNCPKCANSYLLFAPFLPKTELDSLFEQKDLFKNPNLTKDFAGLLGVNGEMKPFECIGEIDELRAAYHMKNPDYSNLPFDIPLSNFNIDRKSDAQDFIKKLFL